MKKKKLKILLYDIENEPNLSYTWGKYEQNVIAFKEEWKLLSFAYKWLGETNVKCLARPDFDDITDKSLVMELWKLLDEADIVIGHNADAFDNKKANARFIELGLPPPSPYLSIDTKKIAKKYFKFNSNSLDDLGKTLGVGQKVKHYGFQLWLDCMNGDPKAWKTMKNYNKQDVVLLEKVYLKLRPWIENHPNVLDEYEKVYTCPKCGSFNIKSQGIRYTLRATYRRYRCLDCKGYCRARKAEKLKPDLV